MRIRYLVPACFALGLFASGAQAQVIVLGNGAAEACWRAAEFGVGDMNEGFTLCSQALSQPNVSLRDRAATLVNRAVIRMRAGDSSGALADASTSSRLMPGLGEAHVNRGAALLNLMRPQEALEAINTGIDSGTTKLHLVYYNRGVAKYLLGDALGSYQDFRASNQINPNFALSAQALTHFTVVPRAGQTSIDPTGEDVEVIALSSPVQPAQ